MNFEKEVQEHIDQFKSKLATLAEKTIQDFYCDMIPHAESDAFTNFRNALLEDICSSEPSRYGYKQREIRAQILREHKEEIASLLNQDLLDEVERLKAIIKTNHYSIY